MNMTQRNKKVIWITGGGTGIGKELAMRFSKKNYNVVISGRRLFGVPFGFSLINPE